MTYNLPFVGPWIAIYFYSKTKQMHNIINLFYFGTTIYMFRTVSPSIIRSLKLYIQHQVYILWLLASIPARLFFRFYFYQCIYGCIPV